VVETLPIWPGVIEDMRFGWMTDFGLPDPDRGAHGKYLLVPPGYTGESVRADVEKIKESAPMTQSGFAPVGPDPGGAPPDGIQALTEQIKRTREDVGETVAALAARADIKAGAQEKAGEVAGRLRDTAGEVKEQLAVPRQRRVVLTAARVVLLAGVLIACRRR
jgi:hypothetical protein